MPDWPVNLDGVVIPEKLALRKEVASGSIERLLTPERTVTGTYSMVGRGADLQGVLTVADGEQLQIVTAPPETQDGEFLIAPRSQILNPSRLFSEDGSLKWWPAPPSEPVQVASQIKASNRAVFRFAKDDATLGEKGLRSPQIGFRANSSGILTAAGDGSSPAKPGRADIR